MRAVAAALLVAAVLGTVSAHAAAASSGLRGRVALSPAGPVCRDDAPCTKPARGVVLVFTRDGRAKRVVTTAAGTYRILLAPGRYTVTAPAFRVGSGVTPRQVRVRRGVVACLDLRVDTGLQ